MPCRAKIVLLTDMAVALTDEWLLPQGFALGSPRDARRRGGHVSITRPDARELCAQLTAVGVLPDFRAPDAIRLGLSPLPTTFLSLWEAMTVIRDLSR